MLVEDTRRRRLLATIAVSLSWLLALAGYVGSMSVPAWDATRLRNALLIDAGTASDFDWTPDAAPGRFKIERLPATERLRQAVERLAIEQLPSNGDEALALAIHLAANA